MSDDILRMLAVLIDESATNNDRYAKNAHDLANLMQSHNELTGKLLDELRAQRRDTAVWWLIAMLVIMGSFWSYL